VNEYVWSNGGMILTGGIWFTGRKTLYFVCVICERMGVEPWRNGTDRGKGNTGRKTLYSVCGRWMNGCGTMAEWYWQGESEVLGGKHYIVWGIDEWLCMEQWWNCTDRENWSTGRETLYIVGGRWMNGCGALVEWYWQGKLKYWEINII